MNNIPLRAKEKQEVKALGLTLTDLAHRYHKAKTRAAKRNQAILPQYDFYREFIRQLKSMAKKLNTTPKALLPYIDIHSLNGGYITFELMMRQQHRLLHSEAKKAEAQSIKEKGILTCRHCGIEKSLSEFVKSRSTYLGYITTCKECDRKMRAEKKALMEVA